MQRVGRSVAMLCTPMTRFELVCTHMYVQATQSTCTLPKPQNMQGAAATRSICLNIEVTPQRLGQFDYVGLIAVSSHGFNVVSQVVWAYKLFHSNPDCWLQNLVCICKSFQCWRNLLVIWNASNGTCCFLSFCCGESCNVALYK